MIQCAAVRMASERPGVSVCLAARCVETLIATDDAKMFQMPYAAGDMLCFAAFDLEKRVTALKDEINS
jgi:hypothetical protein